MCDVETSSTIKESRKTLTEEANDVKFVIHNDKFKESSED